MKRKLLFKSSALWIHDYEIQHMHYDERFTIRHFSFAPPLSKHSGDIILTEKEILLDGDECETIPLGSIEELYYGFDNLYTTASVKNFGAFWKPLRVRHGFNNVTYFIINYNYLYTSNDRFLSLLKSLLLS
ncbi:hypothetical protein H8S90_14590 [Olivibacter sp. SDN3]|uniref:hypothetical protein n=1 Tax=Olivibacter sp. SDN3 TaxID=2764720 RepID=UPI0016519BAA|nr:hypothetical protein [Olivibacter sp. SDN3]QNL48033.1 hypothetical protein H8S90_14590 [Olivibacter sp. SDN3]